MTGLAAGTPEFSLPKKLTVAAMLDFVVDVSGHLPAIYAERISRQMHLGLTSPVPVVQFLVIGNMTTRTAVFLAKPFWKAFRTARAQTETERRSRHLVHNREMSSGVLDPTAGSRV